jgi:hypothetical protein
VIWVTQDYMRLRQKSRKGMKVGKRLLCLPEIQANVFATRGAYVPYTVADFLPRALWRTVTGVGVSIGASTQWEQRDAAPLAGALCERCGEQTRCLERVDNVLEER